MSVDDLPPRKHIHGDGMSDDRFIVKSETALKPLARWLEKRKYNCYSMGHTDRQGNSMFGLSWDYDIDNDWSKKWDKRGLVIVIDKSLYEKVEDAVRGWCHGNRNATRAALQEATGAKP